MGKMYEIREVGFIPGTHIDEALKEALEYAKQHICDVKFNWNGLTITVSYLDNEEELKRIRKTVIGR